MRVVAAFVVVCLAVAIGLAAYNDAFTARIRRAQLTLCERGNILRKETNRRIPAHVREREALIYFLLTARTARLRAGHPYDKVAAHQWLVRARDLRAHVRFHRVALIDCAHVVPS